MSIENRRYERCWIIYMSNISSLSTIYQQDVNISTIYQMIVTTLRSMPFVEASLLYLWIWLVSLTSYCLSASCDNIFHASFQLSSPLFASLESTQKVVWPIRWSLKSLFNSPYSKILLEGRILQPTEGGGQWLKPWTIDVKTGKTLAMS